MSDTNVMQSTYKCVAINSRLAELLAADAVLY